MSVLAAAAPPPRDLLQSDPSLLRRFREGQATALTQVFEAYLGDVAQLIARGFALPDRRARVRGIADPAEQDDIIQDVFMRAFAPQARAAYDGVSAYRPYLFGIARNAIIDRGRRWGRQLIVEAPSDQEPAQATDSEPAPDDLLARARLNQAVRDCVAQMPAPLPAFVEARFVEGLSQVQAAEQLKLSRQEVRTLEDKARKLLKKHLIAAGFGWPPEF